MLGSVAVFLEIGVISSDPLDHLSQNTGDKADTNGTCIYNSCVFSTQEILSGRHKHLWASIL